MSVFISLINWYWNHFYFYFTIFLIIIYIYIQSFLDFFITNTIGKGVLWYVSEALVYAGSIFGVSIYFRTKFGDFESKTKERIKEEINTITDRLAEKIERNNVI